MKKQLNLPESFADLGIEGAFLQALSKVGFEKPSDIQRAMIPEALKGRDILGQAKTGTGKTAAFLLPILHRLMGAPRRTTRARRLPSLLDAVATPHSTSPAKSATTALGNSTS